MAGFLLDTNVLSEFKRRGAPDPNVTTWLRAIDPDLLWASVLSFGEIRKGIERMAPGKRAASWNSGWTTISTNGLRNVCYR